MSAFRHLSSRRCYQCYDHAVPDWSVGNRQRPTVKRRLGFSGLGSILQYRTNIFLTPETSNSINSSPPPLLRNGLLSIHDFSPCFKVTRVSYTGHIKTVELQITELLKSASILPRDLFTLNLTSRQERDHSRTQPLHRAPTAIVPRQSVIVLAFGNLRAVAGLHEVFLLDAHKPSIRAFAEELAAFYHAGELEGESSELVFLELALKDTVASFQRRLRLYEPIIDSFLDKVANEVYSDTGVHLLAPLKDSLHSFEMQVKQSLDCLKGLLEDDEGMLALLITEQSEASQAGRRISFERHEHVELLLGVYARQLNTIAMEINFFLGRIQSKQEFVTLALAGYRNRMVRMQLHLGIAGLSLGLGATVAGFFGMNVVNGFEQSAVAFQMVVLGTGVSSLVMATTLLHYLSGKAMQKRASQRLEEIETLTNALNELCAVDHTLKSTVDGGCAIDKEQFAHLYRKARVSKEGSQKEVDFLFDVFDQVKDGLLKPEDFQRPGNGKKPSIDS